MSSTKRVYCRFLKKYRDEIDKTEFKDLDKLDYKKMYDDYEAIDDDKDIIDCMAGQPTINMLF